MVAIALLFAIPFVSATGERSPPRRPVALLSVMLSFSRLGMLTYLGTYAPWSPHMDAWSSDPSPPEYVAGRTPLELRGAPSFRTNSVATVTPGWQRGAAGAGDRWRGDASHRRSATAGDPGRRQHARVRKKLTPAEVTALVAFMGTLHTTARVRPSSKPQNNLPRDVAALRSRPLLSSER